MKPPNFTWVSPGGPFGVVVWLLASVVFALYVANFACVTTAGFPTTRSAPSRRPGKCGPTRVAARHERGVLS